jgi:hypothetical protein
MFQGFRFRVSDSGFQISGEWLEASRKCEESNGENK